MRRGKKPTHRSRKQLHRNRNAKCFGHCNSQRCERNHVSAERYCVNGKPVCAEQIRMRTMPGWLLATQSTVRTCACRHVIINILRREQARRARLATADGDEQKKKKNTTVSLAFLGFYACITHGRINASVERGSAHGSCQLNEMNAYYFRSIHFQFECFCRRRSWDEKRRCFFLPPRTHLLAIDYWLLPLSDRKLVASGEQ